MLGAIVVALAVGATGRGRGTLLNDGPGCFLKWATGVDCPFCGMTHATVALGAGDWGGAHAAHPLAVVVLIGLVGLLGLVAAGRTEMLMKGRRPLVILGVIVAVWGMRLVM